MSDDLISRQAAIEAMRELPHEYNTKEQRARTGGIAACQTIIRELPSVQQEQNSAYWIGKELGECSNCGHNGCSSDIWDGCLQMFCPNCGAKMEETENDN